MQEAKSQADAKNADLERKYAAQLAAATDQSRQLNVQLEQLRRENEGLQSKNADLERKYAAQLTAATDQSRQLNVQLEQLRRENEGLQSKTAALRRENEGLRSQLVPTCEERKVAGGPIRNVTVVRRDVFQVGSLNYDWAGFLRTVQDELAQADRAQCRHGIRVRSSSSVSGSDLQEAYKTLSQRFYVYFD